MEEWTLKIPKEMFEKYKISLRHVDDKIGMYQTFLKATDYEIIKGFENLLTEPSKFLINIIELAKTLKEVSAYRQIARGEISKE